MADIELVIKIPEEMYQKIKETNMIIGGRRNGKRFDYILFNAVNTGIPLPKGHGALKDFDKIEWYGCDLEGRGCIEAKGDCSVCNHANCYAKQVRELPTIIEADKESEDEE